jgi:hypothetical protein
VTDERREVLGRAVAHVHHEVGVPLRDLNPTDPESLEPQFIDELPRGATRRVLENAPRVGKIERLRAPPIFEDGLHPRIDRPRVIGL